MQRLTTRLTLLVTLVLTLLVCLPPTRIAAMPAGGAQPKPASSTLSEVGIYPEVVSGKTNIDIAVCSDTANAQLRSEQAGVFLSQVFVKATACPVRFAASWRMVTGAVPGECFTIYIWASEVAQADDEFMARAARYAVCVTALGQISTPQRQTVTAPSGTIEAPVDGTAVQGTITVSGWVIDRAAWAGTGVDAVQVYSGATLLGDASYGNLRADVGTVYGDSRYNNSGYTYLLDTARLTNGPATIQVRYHSAYSGQWTNMDRTVTIANPTVGKPVPPPPPVVIGPGERKVPYYQQDHQPWSKNKIGACSSTIGAVGCALTSLAMIFSFYGANQNPGTLNSCMGSDACLMKWDSLKIGSCSGGKVALNGLATFDYARLNLELKTRPVILELHNNATGKSHFIVVTSGGGNGPSNYYVNDPGRPGGEHNKLSATLVFWDKYQNLHLTPYRMRLFSGTPAVATADTQLAEAPPLEAPQPSAAQIVSGAVAVYNNTQTTAILQLAAQSSAGTIADMRIWTDKHPSNIWQPFSQYVQVPLDGRFYAQFRDSAGNTSAIIEAGVPIALSANIQQNTQPVYLPISRR